MSYLIKDTTEEERRRIVEESLGNLSGACDGCSVRVAEWTKSRGHPVRCKGFLPLSLSCRDFSP